MSQSDLADKLYVTPQAVSRWENGTAEPSIDTLKEMTKIFQIPLADLVYGENLVTKAKKAEKFYKIICFGGGGAITIFAIVTIIYMLAIRYSTGWEIAYIAVSLAFLITLLLLELNLGRLKKLFLVTKKKEQKK